MLHYVLIPINTVHMPILNKSILDQSWMIMEHPIHLTRQLAKQLLYEIGSNHSRTMFSNAALMNSP
jgi:hypothetical protein